VALPPHKFVHHVITNRLQQHNIHTKFCEIHFFQKLKGGTQRQHDDLINLLFP